MVSERWAVVIERVSREKAEACRAEVDRCGWTDARIVRLKAKRRACPGGLILPDGKCSRCGKAMDPVAVAAAQSKGAFQSAAPAAEPGDCDCEHKLRIQRLVESVAHERAECARLTRERDALRVALIEACDIASACSALIQSEGLDDDNEGPDVDADIARLRCATSAAKPPAEPKETT